MKIYYESTYLPENLIRSRLVSVISRDMVFFFFRLLYEKWHIAIERKKKEKINKITQ